MKGGLLGGSAGIAGAIPCAVVLAGVPGFPAAIEACAADRRNAPRTAQTVEKPGETGPEPHAPTGPRPLEHPTFGDHDGPA